MDRRQKEKERQRKRAERIGKPTSKDQISSERNNVNESFHNGHGKITSSEIEFHQGYFSDVTPDSVLQNELTIQTLDYVSILLHRQFNVQFGMTPPSIVYAHVLAKECLPAKYTIPPNTNATQIHYIDSHYIVSHQTNTDVIVYDSLFSESRVSRVLPQLKLIYPYTYLDKSKIKYIVPQGQGYSNDCGLFAVANSYYILCDKKPEHFKIEQNLMRPHLRKCLFDGLITNFPSQVQLPTWYDSYLKDQERKNINQKQINLRMKNKETLTEGQSFRNKEQTAIVRKKDKERKALKRLLLPPEQKTHECEQKKRRMASKRASLNQKQKNTETEKNKVRMANTRALLTHEQKSTESKKNKDRIASKRALLTHEQKSTESKKNKDRIACKRALLTHEQKSTESKKNKDRIASRRALLTHGQKSTESKKNKDRIASKRALLTHGQKSTECKKNKDRIASKRALQAHGQKSTESTKNKDRMASRRALQTHGQKSTESKKNKDRMASRRALQIHGQKTATCKKNKEAMSQKRLLQDSKCKAGENRRNMDRMRKKRLQQNDLDKDFEAAKNRQRTSVKRTLDRISKSVGQLKVEKDMEKQRKFNKRHPSNVEKCTELFQKAIADYSKYICTRCHRLLYKQSVTTVTEVFKNNLPLILKTRCIRNVKSAFNKEWICNTCKSYLQKKKLPPQSDANSLSAPEVPKELKELSSLEARLLCQRYPFMKLLALPKGKQCGLKGSVVNVPVDHEVVCHSLPSTPRHAGIIPLKLKRKLNYKGYQQFQYINPAKILKALRWLKLNNSLYQNENVQENMTWEKSCAEEDPDLWKEFTNSGCSPAINSKSDCLAVNSTEALPTLPHSLDMLDKGKQDTEIQVTQKTTMSTDAAKEQSNTTQEEDDYDVDPISRLRGVTYDICIQPTHPELDVDKVVNIAPGENKRPISILMDENFEELAFPHLLPYGKFGWKYNREVPLTPKKYFQKRILDASFQFAQDVEYLFVAQTITETKQIIDSMNIALRKCHRGANTDSCINAGLLRDETAMQRFIFKDQAYRFLQPVRGSPPYWQKVQYKLLAAIKQFGIFTWFFTLSAADLKWHDTIQEIKAQKGETISTEQIDALSWEDKCKILRSNPVTAARHFQHRLDLFLKNVVFGEAKPVGAVLHHFYRIEFQQRGSPHAHGVLWIKGAPDPDKDSEETITAFVDKYVDCAIPADNTSKLHSLVTQLQRHTHTASCTKTGKPCRFNFPKPISSETVITSKTLPDLPTEILAKQKEKAKETLTVVKRFILQTADIENMSYTDVLDSCKMPKETYQDSLKISSSSPTVILRRSPSAVNINNYNKWLLLAWQANMDLQFVSNAYACIQYIVSYITKEEREMGTLLQAVSKENKDTGIKQQMKKCGQAFLKARAVTAQESAYRVLGLPLHKSNFLTVWIPNGLPKERVSLLKPAALLSNLDDDDDNIFMTGILEKYSCRPACLEHWFLALFASWYHVDFERKDRNDFQPDVLGECHSQLLQELEETTLQQMVLDAPTRISLSLPTSSYKMRKRTRQAVIRYHKFSEYRNAESYFHSELLLFHSWRCEELDLLRGFETYLDSYYDCKDTIIKHKTCILKFDQLITEALENPDDPPVSAWDDLAPQSQQQNYDCDEEGPQIDPNHQILYPEQTSEQPILPEPQGKDPLSMAIDIQPTMLPFTDYCKHIQSLNEEQYEVLQIVLNWCITYRQTNVKPNPLHLFVSGGAGTGKSYLIKALYHTIQLTMNKEGEDAGLTKVLLLAPTGTAAFNIEGLTIHSALLFTIGSNNSRGRNSYHPLSDEKRNTLRLKLSQLAFIIIDEISMVGSDLFLRIHNRLQELFGGSAILGGISIIAFGDMYQIPPVAQRFIFKEPTDCFAALAPSLWKENFQYTELRQIMRQQGDQSFAQMLNRIRTAKHTSEDVQLLETRSIKEDTSIPPDTLHVFAFNADVDAHNTYMLHQLPSSHVVLNAVDKKPSSMKNFSLSSDARFTGGLPETLTLATGARIMLIRNINVSDGLVNGARGKVIGFKFSPTKNPAAVFVTFDNPNVGRNVVLENSQRLI